MTVQSEKTFFIDAPPEKVVEVMRSPELIEESERSREAQEVRITEKRKDDDLHEYEIFTKTFARTVKGIDRSKTEDNTTEVSWDLKALKGRWTWRGAHGPRVKVNGGYTVTASGNRSQLVMDAEITVGIPVVGKVVEKKVRDAFESNWPAYVELVKKHVAK